MATENTLRYIKFDYQAQKDALTQRIRARYPKLWNDFLAGGFGTVIIDLVAWAMATLAFGEIMRILMNNLNAPVNVTNGPQGITLIDPVTVLDESEKWEKIWNDLFLKR
mgnify:CR=1 FL=1